MFMFLITYYIDNQAICMRAFILNNAKLSLPSTVLSLPSTVLSLPSTVISIPSTVCSLPSTYSARVNMSNPTGLADPNFS